MKVASVEIPVDANAHTGTADVIKNKKPATCTEEGYTGLNRLDPAAMNLYDKLLLFQILLTTKFRRILKL